MCADCGRSGKENVSLLPLMPNKEILKFICNLVPRALDPPELLWAATFVGVVDTGGLAVGSVDELEIEAGFHAQNSKIPAKI